MIVFQLITKQNPPGRQSGLGKPRAQRGFTIIELLIATAVFSVVLLLIAEGILAFNRAFYQGVTQSNTQNAARSILENISEAIQFNGGTVSATNGASPNKSFYFCVGNTRYRYLLGDEVSGNPTGSQTYHALLTDTPKGGCSGSGKIASINNKAASGTELLNPNMRLSSLSVAPIAGTDLWKIDVRVAYGADNMLYSPKGTKPGATAPDATCHASWAGAQFCATAELSTVVEQRLTN